MVARFSSEQRQQASQAMGLVLEAIEDAVKAAGPFGAPGGHLYAGLMGMMSLDTFQQIMSAMVKSGRVRQVGQCYVSTRAV